MEQIYNQKNVTHIHGNINSDIIFGHGDIEVDYDSQYENEITLPGALWAAYLSTLKDTKSVMKEHGNIFDVGRYENIYVYGFSFGNVDMDYIKKISDNSPNAEWYLACYYTKEYFAMADKLKAAKVDESKIHLWNIY
jgi:hypothetical protein